MNLLAKLMVIGALMVATVPAFAELICVNAKVVTTDHYVGTVTFVYPDGTADVRYETSGYVHTRRVDELSNVRSQIGNFSVGEKVVTTDHYTGTITFVYPDGTADVRYDSSGYVHNRKVSDLAPVQNQIGYFAIGQRVVTTDHYVGVITFVYPDGTADVRYESSGYVHTLQTRVLSFVQNTIDYFSVGEKVVTRDHYVGTITFVYPDRTADVRYDSSGYVHNVQMADLSQIARCSQNCPP